MNPLTLQQLLDGKEGEHLEFKEARNQFKFEELAKYLCAIANEGGGRVVLGVSDKRPRRVVGSRAFEQPERTRADLIEHLRLRIDFDIVGDEGKRILVFTTPSRPVGTPVKYKGVYWARMGDTLTAMSENALREIFAESGHDFSADVCDGASWKDLDINAIEEFRKRWVAKSRNHGLAAVDATQLLEDCEAVVEGRITYAALVLFGTPQGLGRHLGQAELIHEYRSNEASGPAHQRKEFRQGFFGFYDELWRSINLRNDVQHFQDGLFVFDVPVFDERAVREAVLNAVSHRDYQLGGSVFIRQFPRRLCLESPGGLPLGVTPENILDRQAPRNRRIADLFAKCGLVERSGQGMNLMFESSIKQGKPLPDLKGTDPYQVTLTLYGQVEDEAILRVMQEIGAETLTSFSTQDLLVVNSIHEERPVQPALRDRLPRLADLGIVERVARGKYVLARRFHSATGRQGSYTRKKGLDRNTNKELLMKHIVDNAGTGAVMKDLCQVLPGLSRSQVRTLVKEMKQEGRVRVEGITRGARWFPEPDTR